MNDVFSEALERLTYVESTVFIERKQCRDDRRFCNIFGAQWEDYYARAFENKPKLEVNKIHLSIERIVSEFRNSKLNIKLVPMSIETSDKVVDICNSLLKADQNNSRYNDAVKNAFSEAVTGGFGAFKLSVEEDLFDDENMSRVCFEPIYDADCKVFFDSNARQFDKSDASYCFVVIAYDRKSFEEEFGYSAASVPNIFKYNFFDWDIKNYVYLAEYYIKKDVHSKIYIFTSLNNERFLINKSDIEGDPEEYISKMKADGYSFDGIKKRKVSKVRKYLLSGDGVVEDYGYVPGGVIPVVPVYGKRYIIDDIERLVGHVRMCKDAQRLKNMQVSKLAEISAATSFSKPIFTQDQIKGVEDAWTYDNIRNNAFLLKNPVIDVNGNYVNMPTEYTVPPSIPPALAGLLEVSEADIKDILGNYQAGYVVPANTSARAIEMTQNKVDIQSYVYIDNLSSSLKRCAEIWLEMAKDVYSEPGRKIFHYDEGVSKIIDIGSVASYDNDILNVASILSNARLSVFVDIGQTTASQRSNTLNTVSNILPMISDPATSDILQSLMIMNIDSEGIEDVRKYFRKKLVTQGVLSPTEEEKKQIQIEMQQQDDKQGKMQEALTQQVISESERAQSDAMLNMAKADETRAKAMKILSDMGLNEKKLFIDLVSNLKD